jgi:IS5 family transposase
VKKGNAWYFGYKTHIGVDKDSGLVHTVKVTSANVHDVTMISQLLTGDEVAVYGDSGYCSAQPYGKCRKPYKNI